MSQFSALRQPMKTQVSTPTAAYIHIPFCRRRCYYCDFPVSVVGDRLRGETSAAIAQYVTTLCQEMTSTPTLGKSLETVFFGGGTPSLLSVAQLTQILAALDQHFGIASTAEISIEIDPGTFDLLHLQGYVAAGVNRVSLGAQAFQADLLQSCGRTHTPTDIYSAVQLIEQAGLENFSLDLISGLPHLTMAQWKTSLKEAIALHPTHLSVYDLTIEPVTAFGRWYQPGNSPLPTDDMTAQMYRMAQHHLTAAGYTHYEISNYAKPGYQCRHNRVYWENRSYYGFGMGAASYTLGQRFVRPRTRQAYFQWVETFCAAGGMLDCSPTPPEEVLLDQLMLGLRLADGVSLKQLAQAFGEHTVLTIVNCLNPYLQKGWVELLNDGLEQNNPLSLPQMSLPQMSLPQIEHPEELKMWGDRIRLTDPEGFLFSNAVLSSLFEKLG